MFPSKQFLILHLVLQTVLRIPEKRILYVSGEESTRQLKLRADRLTSAYSDCLIVCETSLEQIYWFAVDYNGTGHLFTCPPERDTGMLQEQTLLSLQE